MPFDINSKILELSPYKGGKHDSDYDGEVHILSSNENALGPSKHVIQAICDSAKNIHLYPDGSCLAIKNKIADFWQLDASKIVCSNGSDELISLIIQAFCSNGGNIVYSYHGFLMYPISAQSFAIEAKYAQEENLKTSVHNILATVNEQTKVVFIANPNNPTGTMLDADELRSLREQLADNILLVIDAAYSEFVEQEVNYDAGVQLVNDYDNVVMLRTFSKIFALGGARLGWCYCTNEIADILDRVRGPFNVSSIAQHAGIAALNDLEHFEQSQQHTIKWRKFLMHELKELGLHVPDSHGNFVLCCFETDESAQIAFEELERNGIIVRQMHGYHLPNALRITVGTEKANIKLLNIIKNLRK